jgi:hypothetical protein
MLHADIVSMGPSPALGDEFGSRGFGREPRGQKFRRLNHRQKFECVPLIEQSV